MSKPECDFIKGILPAIAIEQKVSSRNPRSTVGTSTEIYEYLRLLYARIGRTFSPISGEEVKKHSTEDIVNCMLGYPEGTRYTVLAPILLREDRTMKQQLDIDMKQGFNRLEVNGEMIRIDEYEPKKGDTVFLLIDRMVASKEKDAVSRLTDSAETAMYEGDGACLLRFYQPDGTTSLYRFSTKFEADGIAFEEPSDQMFSFNSPIVLSLSNVREAIFNAIPMTLKSAVSVGIGLFVAFVGLQNAKLIVNSDSTLVTYQHFKGETFHSIGVGAILTLVGVLITAILLVKKVKGGILYGILITWVLGILCELTGIYIPNPDAGMYSVIPTSFISFDFSALGKTFGQVFKTDFSGVGILNFFAVMFSFLFVDLFDTLGTLIGVASKADMLDEEGKLPNIKGALMADSIATCAGAVLGTSTTTTFVESASGVTEGGRTGLTSMTTGVLFLLAVVFSPLFLTIPSFATAPALIIVGFYMMGSALKIEFDDPAEGIPAFLTILAMPTAYSISEGIAIGVISWTLLNVITGKAKEKKISPLMYVLTVLFILKYVLL